MAASKKSSIKRSPSPPNAPRLASTGKVNNGSEFGNSSSPFAGLRILLGISGSIAAYRAADLARELQRLGAEIRICLTDGAKQFVTPLLFESLTSQPILESVFDEPEKGRMAHIDWARWADLVLIAPATANIIAKIAHGFADDMLSAICLATTAPIMVAPAMNPAMYAADSNQSALKVLRNRGVWTVEPAIGDVACGEHGQGKLAEISEIVESVVTLAHRSNRLTGKTVLVTTGPTREPIDQVRYISNYSSGKMGAAICRACLEMGANVIAISGPAETVPPASTLFHVHTAQQMNDVAMNYVAEADLVIAVAAVADFRLETPAEGKIRRSEAGYPLYLVPNPDIIANLASAAKPNAKIIGFAAEPNADLSEATQKIARKKLDAIAVNDISQANIGFGADTNQITLVFKDGRHKTSPLLPKIQIARWLLDEIGS